MARGPVGYTCPKIDKLQSRLGDIITQLNDLASEADSLSDDLEVLRRANDDLRTWGAEQEDRAENAESEVEALQSKLDQLS